MTGAALLIAIAGQPLLVMLAAYAAACIMAARA